MDGSHACGLTETLSLIDSMERYCGCIGFQTNINAALVLLSQEFKKHITDESRRNRNRKIGSGKNISNRPRYSSLVTHTRALKFSHQEIRVKKEDNKANLNQWFPDIFHDDSLAAYVRNHAAIQSELVIIFYRT
jgi:hypothetical protein